jgi:hypothetical protein
MSTVVLKLIWQQLFYTHNSQTRICRQNKQVLLAWMFGDNLLLSDFERYGIIFLNDFVIVTVAMVMLLRGFVPYVFCVLLVVIICC